MIRGATRKILDGSSIKIEEPVPEFLAKDGVTEWYMAQPDPELYDDGQMKYHAKRMLALEDPDIKALSKLPPSDDWKKDHQSSIDTWQARIDELVAQRAKAAEVWASEQDKESDDKQEDPPETIGLTAEEAHELTRLLNWKLSTEEHIRTATRATELVNTRANDARAAYMMPWLIVDKDENPIFDMETEEGRKRWRRLSVYTLSVLRLYFSEVLTLVLLAKN